MVISFGIKDLIHIFKWVSSSDKLTIAAIFPECFSKLVKRSGKLGYHLVRGCKNRYHDF